MGDLPNIFYGADLKSLNWYSYIPDWETQACYERIRNYGLNGIRRHFVGEPVYNNNSSYMNRIRHTIDRCAEEEMYVIFDLASWNYGTTTANRQQQETSFYPNSLWTDTRWNGIWTNIGNFVKNDANVYLELGNEPDTEGSATNHNLALTRYASTCTLLRGLGYDNPIGIPGLEYGSSLSPWVSRASSLGDDNLWFFIHRYWYWHVRTSSNPNATSVSEVRSSLYNRGVDDLMNMGYRVCVGEFGVHGTEYNQDPRDRTWFQSMMTVQAEILNGERMDSCYQSFQPGTDFPGIQAGSYSTGWYNQTPTTTFRWFYEGVPSNLQYYGDDPEPDPDIITINPTTTLPVYIEGTVGNSEFITFNVVSLDNAHLAWLDVTVLDTADGGAFGSGNEEGYVQKGSTYLPLPVSEQASTADGRVMIPVSDLSTGTNNFEFHYELGSDTWGYRVDACTLGIQYLTAEGQPYMQRIRNIPGMGLTPGFV